MARADLTARLQEAIALAQAGQRLEARRLLQQILAEDPRLVPAWVWLATVTADRAEKVACLERALALEPDNRTARQAYVQLTGRPYQPPPPPPTRSWRRALTADAPIGLASFIMILLVGAATVIVIALVVNARDDTRPARTPPTPVLASPVPTVTPFLSPTASATRRPTITPGPSPTSIWAAPPPTWTPPPTDTPAPTFTPLPTRTPVPSATHTPWPTPSATFTPLPPTATRTPVLALSATLAASASASTATPSASE
jgi:hypothetical protein